MADEPPFIGAVGARGPDGCRGPDGVVIPESPEFLAAIGDLSYRWTRPWWRRWWRRA